MSETVRDLSDAARVETEYLGLVSFENDNPILDAIVIGCEECGGSGKRKDVWAGAVREVACPSCHGKSYVVSKEARRAFAVAMVAAASGLDEVGEEWEEMCGYWEESYEEAVARFERRMGPVACALLGGEVYEGEVVTVNSAGVVTIPIRDIDGESRYEDFVEGDRIAVLKQGGE